MNKENQFKDTPLCGAKARSRGGQPCKKKATKGSGFNRCRLHGGLNYLLRTNGPYSKNAEEARKSEQELLKEMKLSLMEIKTRIEP